MGAKMSAKKNKMDSLHIHTEKNFMVIFSCKVSEFLGGFSTSKSWTLNVNAIFLSNSFNIFYLTLLPFYFVHATNCNSVSQPVRYKQM